MLITAVLSVRAQSFEVATMKLSGDFKPGLRIGCKGGPGTEDPTRYLCTQTPLSAVLLASFDIQRYQLSAPAWADSVSVDVSAIVPSGMAKEKFRAMLRGLLAERFGMKYHNQSREAPGYDLVVQKGGPKMKPVSDTPPVDSTATAPGPPSRDPEGFPVLPPGRNRLSMIKMGGPTTIVWERANETMDDLASSISNALKRPVHNATGLAGKYEVRLNYSQDFSTLGLPSIPVLPGRGPGEHADAADEDVPTIFSSVQERLGLKLEPKKVTAEYVVIDRLEKRPAEN